MSLPSLSVKRPVAISMFFVGIIFIGVIAFKLLPVEMMPNISFGDITINIDVRGGIPASEVEKRIAMPVEEAVGSVSHLKNILTISKEGNAAIILEFEPGTDMDFAALEVREKFNRIRNKLPAEIEKPVIAKYEYMDVPVMILAVTSTARTPEELRKVVDKKIKDRIQRIDGVARAEVAGGREGKIIVEVDQRKLQAFAIPITRIVDTINLNNANLLLGEIKRAQDKYIVRVIGEFQNLDDMKKLAIATTTQGSVIRLQDVAEVKDSYLDPTEFARLNSQPVVTIYIQKESTANTVKIARLVENEVKILKGILDKDIEVKLTFNQAEAIQQAVNQVKLSLMQGGTLAILILMLFLRDFRLVSIIAASIPISVMFTFSLMFFSKLSLNVMSLSGLALGVGMLVDNSIVVLDNILKKINEASKSAAELLRDAAYLKRLSRDISIEGADEMLLAITASTFTTVIVFLPLVFINTEIKMLYSGIALTITFSLLASLLASLTQIPTLASRIQIINPARQAINSTKEPVSTSLLILTPLLQLKKTAQGIVQKLKQGFKIKKGKAQEERPAEPSPSHSSGEPTPSGEQTPIEEPAAPESMPLSERFQAFYKKCVAVSLSLRYPILFVVVLLFVFSLYASRKLEREFIGLAEQNKFTIFIELPTGARLDVTDRVVSKVEEAVSRVPEVKTATAKVEPWSSKVYVELFPLNKRRKSTSEIIETLRPVTNMLEPAFVYYEEPEEVGTKEILIELYGYDYETLKSLAIQVAQRIQSIPKFTDTKIRMREGRPEIRLYVDKRHAALFGMSVEDVALTLHTNLRGLVATRYRGTDESLIRSKDESDVQAPPPFSTFETRNPSPQRNPAIRTLGIPQEKEETKETESIVRLQERYRRTMEDLRRISLITRDGKQVYLSQVVNLKFDLGPSEIWRKNKSRMVQVSANTGGTTLGTAAERVKDVLRNLELPKDYFWQFGGNYDKMIRNQKELGFAIILSLILVYMILASIFESFSQPFIVLTTVPLAAMGAIAALRLTHKPVGTGVLIGAIMLGGIVVNNAIVLIDRINFLRKKRITEQGQEGDTRQNIINASYDRLRPIMMTSLTTIVGLIPMVLDKSESSNLWSPLAITVVGGMTLSSFLTLFVIPCVYFIFMDFRWRKT